MIVIILPLNRSYLKSLPEAVSVEISNTNPENVIFCVWCHKCNSLFAWPSCLAVLYSSPMVWLCTTRYWRTNSHIQRNAHNVQRFCMSWISYTHFVTRSFLQNLRSYHNSTNSYTVHYTDCTILQYVNAVKMGQQCTYNFIYIQQGIPLQNCR